MTAAIIGAGIIAPAHIDALCSNGIGIAAICDIESHKAENLNRKFGLSARIFIDYREMLKAGGFDAVHICTPHYLHTEMCIEVLWYGYHVLCEKPLCIKTEDLERIGRAVKRSGKTLGVCFQNRYNDSTRLAERYLAGNTIDSAYGSVVWRRTVEYYAQGIWRGKWATEGGGVLINQAIHTVDLLIHFCGMPDSVTATTSNVSLQNVIEVEDTAALRCCGKTNFHFFATNASAHDFPIEAHFFANGEHIVLSNEGLTVNGEKIERTEKNFGEGKWYYGGGHSGLIADFYDCIKNNRPFPIDHIEGGKSIRLILSAYKSKGAEIKL